MNNTDSALMDVTRHKSNRSPKIASKTDEQVDEELFTGHQATRVDFTAELEYYDSPSYCPDRICVTCGIDHDFRPDFRNTRISIDVIPQILRLKSDVIS
jgi:hypothetical protein